MRPGNRDAFDLLLFGPTSLHRTTGVSTAFETLVAAVRQRRIPAAVVDKSAAGAPIRVGAFEFYRAARSTRTIAHALAGVMRSRIVYMTIGSTRLGFIRDSVVIWFASLLGRPVVLHLHGAGFDDFYEQQPRFMQWLVRSALLRAKTIIVLGEKLRRQFEFEPKLVPRIRIVPNGLPAGLRARDRNHPGGKELLRPLRLLFLSNLVESKGYKDVLDACRILAHEREVEFTCSFCGDFVSVEGDEASASRAREEFLNIVRRDHLQERVYYRGVVHGVEKEEALRTASVFLLPTYYPREGQPISIIEAQAFGVPVIATDHGGISEMVTHGANGFLVEPRDPTSIADAVVDMLSDETGYQQMRENSLESFYLNFTHQNHVERLLAAILGDRLQEAGRTELLMSEERRRG